MKSILEGYEKNSKLLALTTKIVASHLSNTHVETAELPKLINTIFHTLDDLSAEPDGTPKAPVPAVPIEDSITGEYLICLEDGRRFKMLKKHLKAHYDMTPEEYRAKWRLPPDYPMVAPNYAAKRQRLARESGLGKSRK